MNENCRISSTATFGHIPSLDGLRGLAIGLVLFRHFDVSPYIPGGFGVTVFFFISGLLITRLLLAEFESHGRINLTNFYIRRFLRLMPALFALVGGTLAVRWLYNLPLPTIGEPLSVLLYYRNYYNYQCDLVNFQPVMRGWNQTWSLAIEEHFYLLFPPSLILAIRYPKKIVLLFAVLAVLPLFLRTIYWFTLQLPENYNYSASETRLDAILAGCLLSLVCHYRFGKTTDRLFGNRWLFWGAVYGLGISFVFREPFFQGVLKYSVQEFCLFVLCYQILFKGEYPFLQSILQNGVLCFIGKISYSIYLWHWQARYIKVFYPDIGFLEFFLIAITITLVLACFSYFLIEMPVVGLRRKFGSQTSGNAKSQKA